MTKPKGFTLIELLVVISIIALLSSVIAAQVIKTRVKARDTQRLQNARQLAIALEQYEATYNTYKIPNSGKNNEGYGYVAKETGSPGYTTSILSTLKSVGLYNSTNLIDPVYGTDNYYLGLCTSTNAYNVFVKLEQSQYNNSTTSISNSCGGTEAASLGFNYIASTAGGSSGGGGSTGGYTGYVDTITGQDGLTYGTVLAEDGRIWLDRNLGATQVATAYNDYLSYGSKFQWGRRADGHQLINYTSASAGTGVNGVTATLATTSNPLHNLFITINSGLNDWRDVTDNTLWQGIAGTNNPCPTGFRLPTQTEWQTWTNAANITTCSSNCREAAYNTSLKLPTAGYRTRIDGAVSNLGSDASYWSSTPAGARAYGLYFDSSAVYPADTSSRAFGFSVRCLKD